MEVTAFSAKCPHKIGDKVQMVIPTETNEGGLARMIRLATITDIACTHYLREGKVLFTYELDGAGEYIPLMTAKEAGLV